MSFYPLDARRPGDLLRTHSTLKGLFRQARAVERMQVLIDSVLEPAAREHCRAASYQDGVLRLLVADSHWATRIRYQQKRLIRQLQAYAEFTTLTKIHCKVQPPLVKKSPPVRKMRRSIVAAESLFETSQHIEDPNLRAALERLARHHRGDA
ncbi:MAG: DciA family protein [Pseudomonas sp.]